MLYLICYWYNYWYNDNLCCVTKPLTSSLSRLLLVSVLTAPLNMSPPISAHPLSHCQHMVYSKTFEGANFCGFRRFLALPQKFSRVCFACYWRLFIILMKRCHLQLVHKTFPAKGVFRVTAKIFPLKSFAVYGMLPSCIPAAVPTRILQYM